MKIKLFIKHILAKFCLITEFCHECGVKQPLVWTAPNDLWIRIVGHAGGVLCPKCFDKKCAERGMFVRWIPIVEKGET